MRSASDDKALRKLGTRLEQVERGAPTRPHPSGPDGQPNRALATPFIALYDRMRGRA